MTLLCCHLSCYLFHHDVVTSYPLLPMKWRSTKIRSANYECQCFLMMLFKLRSPRLFHHFVQQFLLAQDKSYHHYFDFFLFFLPFFPSSLTKRNSHTSCSSRVCFREPPPKQISPQEKKKKIQLITEIQIWGVVGTSALTFFLDK